MVPIRPSICVLIALALLWSAAGVSAQTLDLNRERIQIAELIKIVGEAMDQTVLFDDSVRGQISIVAQRPVTYAEAWSMLDTSLLNLGYSLIPSPGEIWRVAKIADAVGESPFKEKVETDSHAYVTSLIPLRFADPAKVLAVLQPIAGTAVSLVALDEARSLIASGSERRIARLMSIADALDRVEEREVQSFLLRYRDVGEVESWLEPLLESDALDSRAIEVWTDERTNSLIYRGTDSEVERLLGFLHRFDLPVQGKGQLHVLRVLNRDAEEVAELLRALGEGASGNAAVSGPGQSLSRIQSADYTISVDTASRSLVVRGDAEAQAVVREALEILDQAPQLVAVDLIITEMRTPTSFSLGFGFSIPLTTGDERGEVLGRLISNPSGAGFSAVPSLETTFVGRVDQDLNVPLFIDPTTGLAIPIANTGVVTAGDVKVRTEILIEPHLVLTAGDQHEIFVGANLPVPVTGDSGITGGGINGGGLSLSRTINFERRDVGISVGIEARAGKIGMIELDLDVEISSLIESLAGAVELVGPTFGERQILTKARMRDGEVAMLALNRGRTRTEGNAGTPFLSDLPFLGRLFTDRVERSEDVHLILAARAKRIGSPSELVAHTIRKRLAFERRDAREASMPEVAKGEPAYAVLVTTRDREDDARSIADGLAREGHETEVHSWKLRGKTLFDVYVRDLGSLAVAADVASRLSEAGWEPDLTLLPTTRSHP